MSKYTTQVRFICETSAGLMGNTGYSSVNEVIQRAIPKIFDFDFPIYDESYRNVLCGKILKHYYTREIGAETVGLWKLWLDTRLNEIMPYYNQLYKSAVIEFNPMYDVELTTTHSGKNDGTTNKTGSNNRDDTRTGNGSVDDEFENTTLQNGKVEGHNVNRDMYSDTPQGALDNVENNTYLTNARKVTGEGSSNTESTDASMGTNSRKNNYSDNLKVVGNNTEKVVANSTEEYTQKIIGKTGGASYSKRLQEFRATFLNIDAMIIDELKDLFFNLW